MNTPYSNRPLRLTREDCVEWWRYESGAAKAKQEYIDRPIARPHVSGLLRCLCCAVLTEQPRICLTCRRLAPGWAEFVDDLSPYQIHLLRRPNEPKAVPA